MSDKSIFNVTFNLDVPADVSIDFSAGQGYSSTNSNSPWGARIVVDGSNNVARGGGGAVTDVISVMGAAGQLSAGGHRVEVIWYGQSNMTLNGAVIRILITKR